MQFAGRSMHSALVRIGKTAWCAASEIKRKSRKRGGKCPPSCPCTHTQSPLHLFIMSMFSFRFVLSRGGILAFWLVNANANVDGSLSSCPCHRSYLSLSYSSCISIEAAATASTNFWGAHLLKIVARGTLHIFLGAKSCTWRSAKKRIERCRSRAAQGVGEEEGRS